MASRSSSISSRMFGGTSADIAALKAELAALKASGGSVSPTVLSDAVKPVKDQVDSLSNLVVTENAAIGKKAATAEFNASEALKNAATAAVEISKIPGQIQDVQIDANGKISSVRIGLQELSLKHDDLSTFVNAIDTNAKALAATIETIRQTMVAVDGKVANIENVLGNEVSALAARVSAIEAIL